MAHPEMDLEINFQNKLRADFYPIYPSTEKLINKGISQRVIQKLMTHLIEKAGEAFKETLPRYIIDHYKFIAKSKALKEIHYPNSHKDLVNAESRLKFEEFFYMQLQLLLKNLQRKKKIRGFVFSKVGSAFNIFFKEHLPG